MSISRSNALVLATASRCFAVRMRSTIGERELHLAWSIDDLRGVEHFKAHYATVVAEIGDDAGAHFVTLPTPPCSYPYRLDLNSYLIVALSDTFRADPVVLAP